MNTISPSSFREVPRAVEPVLIAARRIYPQHSLFVTFEPDEEGPAWEFHPFKRWLVLRTDDPDALIEAVACSLLARTAWLGKGAVTTVPEHLNAHYRSALGALLAALAEAPRTVEAET
jgi:hypothetical protein